MLDLFRRGSKPNVIESPSAGLGGMLGELSCNSPSGPLRVNRGKKGERASPYKGHSRRSQRLLGAVSSAMGGSSSMYGAFDDAPLLTPGRKNSSAFVADKHVIVKKSAEGGKVGMRFRDATEVGIAGVLLTHVEDASPAAASTLLVGDVITSVDGKTVTDGEEAARRACCRASNLARSSVPSQWLMRLAPVRPQ